jgi:hypothetical protein
MLANNDLRSYFFWIFFPQRAFAAFLALSESCLAVIFAARAFPPFSPPRRPNSTASGSLPSLGAGVCGAAPVASSTMRLASWDRSRRSFGLRERFGIPTLCTRGSKMSTQELCPVCKRPLMVVPGRSSRRDENGQRLGGMHWQLGRCTTCRKRFRRILVPKDQAAGWEEISN